MEQNTVFVVGAGASKEFGLPIGSELGTDITRRLDIRFEDGFNQSSGDQRIAGAARQTTASDFNNHLYAAWRIRDGLNLADSIDNFIDKHHQDERLRFMGELGIVTAIGEAERASALWTDPRHSPSGDMALDFTALEQTWLKKLFRRMQRQIRSDAIENLFQRVTFVVFNYDRCLEHFLLWAIRQSYGIDERAAARIVETANIIHPYGVIGSLPWQLNGTGVKVAYGADRLPILEMAKGIRTYADRIDDSEILSRIHRAISDAELICFLGFSYLEQNLQLLTPDGDFRTPQVFGTTHGISEFNAGVIAHDLKSRFKMPAHREAILAHSTCAKFASDFERAFN